MSLRLPILLVLIRLWSSFLFRFKVSLLSAGGKGNNVSIEGTDGASVDAKFNNLAFRASSAPKFVEGARARKVFSDGGNAKNSVVDSNAGKLVFEILDSPKAGNVTSADKLIAGDDKAGKTLSVWSSIIEISAEDAGNAHKG